MLRPEKEDRAGRDRGSSSREVRQREGRTTGWQVSWKESEEILRRGSPERVLCPVLSTPCPGQGPKQLALRVCGRET